MTAWLTPDVLAARVDAEDLDVAVPEDAIAVAALLRAAHRDVRGVIGAASPAVLDPDGLSGDQRQALADAVFAAACHRLTFDLDELLGGPTYLSGRIVQTSAGRLPPTPEVHHALAGSGLVARSLCAPPPTPDAA